MIVEIYKKNRVYEDVHHMMRITSNKKRMLLVAGVLWMSPALSFVRGRSFLMPRSQSVHAERELVGWQETINLFDECCGYASFAINPGYTRSFHPSHIADYFFGNTHFTVSGSQVPNRGDQDILADYFGLPTDFQSCISFKPLVQNEFVDVNFFVGLDALWHGLYFRMHIPFVHTSWDMRLSECVIEPGVNQYPAGYMASDAIDRAGLACNASDWFSGQRSPIGDLQPLRYGIMDGARTESGLSDIRMALGWNPFVTDDYHFGINVLTSIPTGNVSKSVYLFEPMIGNGRHWEFGFGLSGHTKFFESQSECHRLLVYGDINVGHLFGSCQKRSFDFKQNGPSSRYMLIEEIGTPIVHGLGFGDFDVDPELNTFVAADAQYHGKVMPAINKTTLNVHVYVAVQADVVLKFTYGYKDFTVDVGYNFWGRTSEQFRCREALAENSYAIKGDALLYGFAVTTPDDFVALNATQSQATLFAGQGNGNGDFLNTNADNSSQASFVFDLNQVDLSLFGQASELVSGSKQSIFIKDCDIDNLSGLASSAIANTFFTHINYHWSNARYVEPYLGFGGEVTLDGQLVKRSSMFSEWAVWMKVGVSC